VDDIFDKVKVDGDESLPCLGELIEDFVLVAVDDAFDHLPQHGRDSLQLLNERPVPEQTCYNLQGGSSGHSYGKSPAEVGVKCSTDDVLVAI